MIPLMYPFSRLFRIPSTAMVTLKSVNIFLGTVSTLSTFILEYLAEDDRVSIAMVTGVDPDRKWGCVSKMCSGDRGSSRMEKVISKHNIVSKVRSFPQ